MSAGSIRIGSPLGIPVRLHYTWWLIFFPVLFTLAQSIYPEYYRDKDLPRVTLWTMAGLATVLLFVSLLLHEFGHAAAARRFGIPVHSVELFVLGGAAKMIGFTRRPRDEFVLAAAGPVVSLVFALLAVVLFVLLRFGFGLDSPMVDVLVHVALFNLATVAFNLIPAYPLDGGRVLQGILWHITGSRSRAAMAPAAIGAILGGGLIGYGLWQVRLSLESVDPVASRQYLMAGLWPAVIGAFIGWSSLKSYRSVCHTERVAGMTVGQALDGRVRPVTATMDLASARQAAFATGGPAVVPVLGGDGRAEALLVEEAAIAASGETTVAQVAERIPSAARVPAASDLFNAALAMARSGDPWLVVEDAEGRYVGMLTGQSLRTALRPPAEKRVQGAP